MEDNNKILANIKERNTDALETITEVVNNTYSGRISRAFNAGLALLLEYVLYACGLGTIIFIFIMERITPFHLLRQMSNSSLINDVFNPHEISSLSITIKIILGVLACFLIATAYLLRKNRKYKANIQDSIASLKSMKENISQNNKELIEIESATHKVLEAAVLVANEADVK